MSTLRSELRDRLRPIIPRDYKLRPNGLLLEQLPGPVLQIKQLRIEPNPDEPAGALQVHFMLTMVVPLRSPQAAEDKLDDDVLEMLAALDQIGWVNWTQAEKVTAGPDDHYLGYDITIICNTNFDPEA